MKTPLTELIEKIDTEINDFQANGDYGATLIIRSLNELKDKAQSLLEKEKQMVIDAFNNGEDAHWCHQAEEYFNETFKQQ